MSTQRSISDFDLACYADQELDEEHAAEVEAELERDPTLAARLEAWRHSDDMLRSAFSRVAAEPLPAALLSSQKTAVQREQSVALGNDEPIRAPIRQVRRIERIRREQREKVVALTVASFAAGALAMLSAAGFTALAPSKFAGPAAYLFPRLAAEDVGERLTQRAMEAFWTFANDSIHPVEVSSPADIASWLSRRVGAPVHAPDLSSVGLKLLGGRLTPGEHGPAALILYETPSGNRIALYVGRTSSEEKSFQYLERRVTGAVWWMERGASYALVGRSDRLGLTKIAKQAREQEPAHQALQMTSKSSDPSQSY